MHSTPLGTIPLKRTCHRTSRPGRCSTLHLACSLLHYKAVFSKLKPMYLFSSVKPWRGCQNLERNQMFSTTLRGITFLITQIGLSINRRTTARAEELQSQNLQPDVPQQITPTCQVLLEAALRSFKTFTDPPSLASGPAQPPGFSGFKVHSRGKHATPLQNLMEASW